MSSDASRRTLVLMRHAKSDWSNGSLADHDRPLNDRGQRAAPRMAVWLKSIGATPDLILSSTAKRTCETVQLVTSVLNENVLNDNLLGDVEVSFDESLYLSSPEVILRTIRSHGEAAHCLMVVAHNPGMSHLSSVLAEESLSMPTAAVAVFRVAVERWSELTSAEAADRCELIEFMRPKALDQS